MFAPFKQLTTIAYYHKYIYIVKQQVCAFDTICIKIDLVLQNYCEWKEHMSTLKIGTADGMLTRATPTVPAGSRARTITVTGNTQGLARTISISISPSTILTFEFDPATGVQLGSSNGLQSTITAQYQYNKEKRNRWYGWAWRFIDTTTWYHTKYELSEREAVMADSMQGAVIEHLRYIMNRGLCIRPMITEHVCREVERSIVSKDKTKQTFKGVRTIMSQIDENKT